MIRVYLSDRNIPLVFHGWPPNKPTITVENYCKWYNLFIVNPDGSVGKVPVYDHSKYEGTTWYDHVPHPGWVKFLEREYGYEVDDESFEMMIGRYHLEVLKEVY